MDLLVTPRRRQRSSPPSTYMHRSLPIHLRCALLAKKTQVPRPTLDPCDHQTPTGDDWIQAVSEGVIRKGQTEDSSSFSVVGRPGSSVQQQFRRLWLEKDFWDSFRSVTAGRSSGCWAGRRRKAWRIGYAWFSRMQNGVGILPDVYDRHKPKWRTSFLNLVTRNLYSRAGQGDNVISQAWPSWNFASAFRTRPWKPPVVVADSKDRLEPDIMINREWRRIL